MIFTDSLVQVLSAPEYFTRTGHATSHGALLIGQSHSNPCIVPVPVVPGSRYPHSVSCVDVSQWLPWAQETLRHPPHIVDLDSISTLITNVEALNNFELKDNFVLYADCRGNPDADRNKFLSNLHYPSGKHYVRGSFLVLQTSRDGTVKDFELRNEALVLYLIRVSMEEENKVHSEEGIISDDEDDETIHVLTL